MTQSGADPTSSASAGVKRKAPGVFLPAFLLQGTDAPSDRIVPPPPKRQAVSSAELPPAPAEPLPPPEVFTKAVYSKDPVTDRKFHQLQFISTHMRAFAHVSCDKEFEQFMNFVRDETTKQALIITGPSFLTTNVIVRAFLSRICNRDGMKETPSHPDARWVIRVDCAGVMSCEDAYEHVRYRANPRIKMPPWRRMNEFRFENFKSRTPCVVVLENIEDLIRATDAKQPTLDKLLRFLNSMAATVPRFTFIVVGHSEVLFDRLRAPFGGFRDLNPDTYVMHLPSYTFRSLTSHLTAIVKYALERIREDEGEMKWIAHDFFAPKALQLVAQKALRYGECEFETAVWVLQNAINRLRCECREYEDDPSNPPLEPGKVKIQYGHVARAAANHFKHNYVCRIEAVGVIPQAILLVLIDSGPCTADELIKKVEERGKVHSWIWVVSTFRESLFEPALKILKQVPLVTTHEVYSRARGKMVFQDVFTAIPTRDQLIEAAGKTERIRLIL
ncbi:hypothetical protein Poli38472_009434 [Pythium oligandrum]|uniref:Uncharacterized protein n=1 Tax=Pythium oligandrum TaxID=41045 RepID=A0A8K1FMW7_PYTOL|nr:hypothetical protein Poli38472_009434 [Pythium oligandrum]|eukprot:TMW65267.1 hypothetical protein Poli38472_009434 [Pythium oligandrum]